jgi:hypothetical protein
MPITDRDLIEWGESQQSGLNTPAKYRFVEYHLEEVRRDYERSKNSKSTLQKWW